MLITEEVFEAFLKCETKSYLKFSATAGGQNEFRDWQRQHIEDFRQQCCARLCSKFGEDECLSGASLPQALGNMRNCLVLDCLVQAGGMQSHIHALERLASPDKKYNPYIPIRFVPNEKITRFDKLLLSFDALVLSSASGKMPLFGKIIHGHEQKASRIQLTGLMKTTRSTITKIAAQQTSTTPPQLILNRHCAECEFQSRCYQIAVEKDDLSLLAGISEKERKKQHGKGIFSVTQLSYTFRPRRKPKRLAAKPEKYHHALKALAIRENKIHIVGRPELRLTGKPVYLDVEGVPDRDFYYLIGLRINNRDSYVQHSFWANEFLGEKEIWASLLRVLSDIENPQLIYYGSYETTFLKRMTRR